jgi:hypothetical protein
MSGRLAYVQNESPSAIDRAALEAARVDPPKFDTLEEFFAWQRELYRPKKNAPMPSRTVVVALDDHEIAVLVRALGPFRLITPFGNVVLDAGG